MCSYSKGENFVLVFSKNGSTCSKQNHPLKSSIQSQNHSACPDFTSLKSSTLSDKKLLLQNQRTLKRLFCYSNSYIQQILLLSQMSFLCHCNILIYYCFSFSIVSFDQMNFLFMVKILLPKSISPYSQQRLAVHKGQDYVAYREASTSNSWRCLKQGKHK